MRTTIYILICVFVLVGKSFGQTEFSILIDPGHGGDDAGTVGYDGEGWPNEEDITLTLGDNLHSYLNLNGIISSLHIYITRISDAAVTPENRARMAKGEIADAYWHQLPRSGDGLKDGVELFLSIHCNSGGSTSQGTLGLIYDAVNDETPSDRSSNDYLFAMNVVRSYVDSTKTVYSGASIRTSQYSPDGVGGRSNLPMLSLASVKNGDNRPRAVTILETEFASNNTTWTWLRNSNYQAAAVKGMAAGVVKAKDVVTGIGPPGSPPVPGDFRASVSGQDVILSWTRPADFWIWGHHVYKNGSLLASLYGSETAYTDHNAVGGFPAEYYVGAWNGAGESTTDPIRIVGPATITNATTWAGIVQADGSVVVNSGASLTISPGTVVMLKSGTSISSSGRITANGTRESPIVFLPFNGSTPGSWGSIQFNGSGASGSSLNYVNINDGTEIDVLNGANNVHITNCNISNNSGHGIYVYSCSGFLAQGNRIANSNIYHGIRMDASGSCNCYENVIYKTNHNRDGGGILYSGSYGFAWRNDVDYYNWGIAAIWGASPQCQNPSASGGKNNRITNCRIGVNVYQNSYPLIGEPYPTFGVSSIYDNDVDVSLNMSYSTVSNLDALGICWKNGNPSNAVFRIGAGSTLWVNPYVTTNYWASAPLPSVQSPDNGGVKASPVVASVSSSDSQSSSIGERYTLKVDPGHHSDSLLIGMNLLGKNKHKEARDYFMSYLGRHPDDQAAYVGLYSCADSETTPSIIEYFRSLPRRSLKEHKLFLSYLHLFNGDTKSAARINDEIASDNYGTPLGTRATLNNFYLALYDDNDPAGAASILKKVLRNAKLSTPVEISDAEWALKAYVDPKTGRMPFSSSSHGDGRTFEAQLPEEGGMIQNYPNPFNPTTTISYRLPKSGKVELKVYDILGREVVTLVSGNLEAGAHTAQFKGERLASGVYFYRLSAPGISVVKKMLMVK